LERIILYANTIAGRNSSWNFITLKRVIFLG